MNTKEEYDKALERITSLENDLTRMRALLMEVPAEILGFACFPKTMTQFPAVEKWIRNRETILEDTKMDHIDQLHAGKLKGTGDDVWHSSVRDTENDPVVYWCGSWRRRTPKELFKECMTIIQDLLKNHPDILEP